MKGKSGTLHEAWMVRFQQHLDAEAFEKLVTYYTTPALAVARQILSDGVLAEDAVQETFLKVVHKRMQYNPSQPFSCWFYAILRNRCVDMLRQRSRHLKAIEKITDWAPPVTDRNDEPEYGALELLEEIGASEQAVLKLRIINDMSFRDIASAIGISTEAAKKRAQRGLKKLREKVKKQPYHIKNSIVNPNPENTKHR